MTSRKSFPSGPMTHSLTEPLRPMYAASESQMRISDWGQWAIEIKYDGHRMIIYRVKNGVHLFARPTDDGRMLERPISNAMIKELLKFPVGVYDGELLGGDTGTDVSRLDLFDERYLVVFDVLEVEGRNWMEVAYDDRRQALREIFKRTKPNADRVQLAVSERLESEDQARSFFKQVLASGGEGAILKNRQSKYHPSARHRDLWVKMKRKSSAALKIVGFKPSRGSVRFPGHPFAIVKLRDKQGNDASCKTRNDYELKQFEKRWLEHFPHVPVKDVLPVDAEMHPDVGRFLFIEFPRRTRSGGYQGPVLWDRWAEKGEVK